MTIYTLIIVGCCGTNTTTKINPNDFTPSGANHTFPVGKYSSFDEYIKATSQIVQKHLVPISDMSRAKEIQFATPYQLTPSK